MKIVMICFQRLAWFDSETDISYRLRLCSRTTMRTEMRRTFNNIILSEFPLEFFLRLRICNKGIEDSLADLLIMNEQFPLRFLLDISFFRWSGFVIVVSGLFVGREGGFFSIDCFLVFFWQKHFFLLRIYALEVFCLWCLWAVDQWVDYWGWQSLRFLAYAVFLSWIPASVEVSRTPNFCLVGTPLEKVDRLTSLNTPYESELW